MIIQNELFINILIICFGLIVGSFLNVVVARLPHRKSLVSPPSHCPQCQAKIKWYDNFPVFSYLFLRGQCRECHTKISVRYPIIELLTAFLFLVVKVRFGYSWVLWIRDFPFIAILIATTFIDLEHRLIPDPLSLGGLVLGLATSFFDPVLGFVPALMGAGVGFIFFYGMAWYYQKRTGRSGLGGGDIKFLAMLGAFLGVKGVITTVLVSSVTGTVIGLTWAWIQKRKDPSQSMMKTSIPYGPFLVIGGLYFYLLGELIWSPFMNPM